MEKYDEKILELLKEFRDRYRLMRDKAHDANKALDEYLDKHQLPDGSLPDECLNSSEYKELVYEFNNHMEKFLSTGQFIGKKILEKIHIAEENGWI